MNADYKDLSTEHLVQYLQDLEHSYAEAFADGVDSSTLTNLWQKIKEIQSEISHRRPG